MYGLTVDDEGAARLATVASLSARLLKLLDAPDLEHLAADRLRIDIRALHTRALSEIAESGYPRSLHVVEPFEEV